MKSALYVAMLLVVAGCAKTPPLTTTIKGQNNGDTEQNYDRAFILALDCKRFPTPQLRVMTSAGWHFLLVRVTRMRGIFPRPEEAEIPLFATFEPDREYNIDGGVFREHRIGINLYTDDHLRFLGGVDVEPPGQ